MATKKKATKKSTPVKSAGETTHARSCSTGVCDPRRTQGLRAPAPQGTHDLVSLEGPGVFLGLHVSKQGGTNDITFVILEIDGRNVTNLSFAAAANWGLTQQNPYGLMVVTGGPVKTLTVGFPTPLRFQRSLKLSVRVNEPGVVQIVANVIHGSAA
jgi:hypothetical protein